MRLSVFLYILEVLGSASAYPYLNHLQDGRAENISKSRGHASGFPHALRETGESFGGSSTQMNESCALSKIQLTMSAAPRPTVAQHAGSTSATDKRFGMFGLQQRTPSKFGALFSDKTYQNISKRYSLPSPPEPGGKSSPGPTDTAEHVGHVIRPDSTDKKALRVIAQHYRPAFEEAQRVRAYSADAKRRTGLSSGRLLNAAFSWQKLKALGFTASAENFLVHLKDDSRQYYIDREAVEQLQTWLRVMLVDGKPAHTYAKLAVAGIRPRDIEYASRLTTQTICSTEYTPSCAIGNLARLTSPGTMSKAHGRLKVADIGPRGVCHENSNQIKSITGYRPYLQKRHPGPSYTISSTSTARTESESSIQVIRLHSCFSKKGVVWKANAITRALCGLVEEPSLFSKKANTLKRSTKRHYPAASLAQAALRIVAVHSESRIPGAQQQSSEALEAFERAEKELQNTSKGSKKNSFDLHYEAQHQHPDVIGRYRAHNRERYFANENLRTLHETYGKLRDAGLTIPAENHLNAAMNVHKGSSFPTRRTAPGETPISDAYFTVFQPTQDGTSHQKTLEFVDGAKDMLSTESLRAGRSYMARPNSEITNDGYHRSHEYFKSSREKLYHTEETLSCSSQQDEETRSTSIHRRRAVPLNLVKTRKVQRKGAEPAAVIANTAFEETQSQDDNTLEQDNADIDLRAEHIANVPQLRQPSSDWLQGHWLDSSVLPAQKRRLAVKSGDGLLHRISKRKSADPDPMAPLALGVVAQHAQCKIEASQARREEIERRFAETLAEVAYRERVMQSVPRRRQGYLAPRLLPQDLATRHRFNHERLSKANRDWQDLYLQGGPVDTLQRIRGAIGTPTLRPLDKRLASPPYSNKKIETMARATSALHLVAKYASKQVQTDKMLQVDQAHQHEIFPKREAQPPTASGAQPQFDPISRIPNPEVEVRKRTTPFGFLPPPDPTSSISNLRISAENSGDPSGMKLPSDLTDIQEEERVRRIHKALGMVAKHSYDKIKKLNKNGRASSDAAALFSQGLKNLEQTYPDEMTGARITYGLQPTGKTKDDFDHLVRDGGPLDTIRRLRATSKKVSKTIPSKLMVLTPGMWDNLRLRETVEMLHRGPLLRRQTSPPSSNTRGKARAHLAHKALRVVAEQASIRVQRVIGHFLTECSARTRELAAVIIPFLSGEIPASEELCHRFIETLERAEKTKDEIENFLRDNDAPLTTLRLLRAACKEVRESVSNIDIELQRLSESQMEAYRQFLTGAPS